jgi:hypothetical protein
MPTPPFPVWRAALLGAFISTAVFAQAPAPKLDFPKASPPATIKQRVGLTDIEVTYSRPSLKGRVIFGQLEPYGKVWRTGADSATRITFSTDVKVQGAALAAGTYELFTIPDPAEWTVIFQKAGKQWGAYAYKPENDTLRVTARVQEFPFPLETFTIDFNDLRDTSASLNLVWEKTLVSLKLEVDVSSIIPQIEAVLAAPGEKKPYIAAAMFYLDHNLDLKKAAQWMDLGIAEQPENFRFPFTYRKARILAAAGDKAGARAAAEASLADARKAQGLLKDEYVRLNEALLAGLK